MRSFATAIAGAMLVSVLAAGPAAAQAAKFAAHVKDLTIVPATGDFAFATVLETGLKTPNKKDLLIGVSLETGIYTRTKVTGKNGETDTATAFGGLFVRVLIDGQQASPQVAPTEVVYDKRTQTLNATLGGVIESCQDTGTFTDGDTSNDTTPDGVITVEFECVVSDEEIELVLDTMAAHHFNFVARDLPSGNHTITVQVLGDVNGDGDFDATVTVGRGSLTVEEVRATNQEGGIVFQN